ncbi:unnamed protein product [Symbiodinium microadriaticum]|nr:unnamed protein product [Symbiodinium microadriaticum]
MYVLAGFDRTGAKLSDMAEIRWFTAKAEELSGHQHGSAARDAAVAAFVTKFEFMDALVSEGKSVGNLLITAPEWEAAVEMFRKQFARFGVYLRPKLHAANDKAAPLPEAQLPEMDSSSENPSPGQPDFTPTEILYIKTEGASRGLLQVHKVPEPILGYRLLLRAEEIWALLKQDGLASDVAESWRVDVNSHFVRKHSYKGAGSMVDASLLQVQRGFVSLNNWQNFLEFTGLLPKWQQCKLLSKAEQSVDTGVRLHVATWFILRCAHAEKFDMAIDRFVARSGGFASAASETTLAEVGLEALAPSNYQRTTCDFIHRYLKKAESEVGEVWMGVVALPGYVSAVAALVCDSRTETLAADVNKQEAKKKLPKALNSLKEDRLAAKQELKAICNIMQHTGLDLDSLWPSEPLRPLNPDFEERHIHVMGKEQLAFIRDIRTDQCRWDVPLAHTAKHLRLVLCPDQGSPLFAGYQYLCHNDAAVALIRDEMYGDAVWVFVPCQKAGVNPFQILDGSNRGESSYAKTVDTCVKALMDEQLFSIYKVLAVKFVRPQHLHKVLPECLTMFLGMTHELNQYGLYLCSMPAQSAGLLSSKAEDEAKSAILESMSREWKLVLSLEAKPQARILLHQHCGYVLYQQYRELMGCFERSGFKLTRDSTDLLHAWFPEVPWSANLESVFGEMQHAIRRSGKADVGSLSNLMSVAIRGLERRVFTDPEENPKPLRLVPDDWDGDSKGGHNHDEQDQHDGDDADGDGDEDDDDDNDDVKLFEYTVHLAPKGLEDKCGCGFLLRRGVKSFGLVAYLVHNMEILKLHSATISEILFEADIRLPKNTSKGLKIRRVLEMDSVKNHVSEGTIASIKKILDEQDEKRKQSKEQKQEAEQNEEEEIMWEELESDPAAVACRELLSRLDDEDTNEEDSCIIQTGGSSLGDIFRLNRKAFPPSGPSSSGCCNG